MVKRHKTKNGKTYEYNSLEINGIQKELAADLKNISDNLGIKCLSEFLRPELRKIRDSYPVNMRQSPDAA